MDSIQSSAVSAGIPNQVVVMQLAAIAACSEKGTVAATLASYNLGWKVVWQPKAPFGPNYAYIAENIGGSLAVCIRGSVPIGPTYSSIINWLGEDLNIFSQVRYPYFATMNPMISKGALDGLNRLIDLKDAAGVSISDFINREKPGIVIITGHSLGGNLATVFAPYLRSQMSNEVDFYVATFAAPTSWNADFAAQFDSAFAKSWRYYNDTDIVPMAAAQIADIGKLFPEKGPRADKILLPIGTLAGAFSEFDRRVRESEERQNSYYTPVNRTGDRTIVLSGKVTAGGNHLLEWLGEVGKQHSQDTYLELLGSQKITCVLP